MVFLALLEQIVYQRSGDSLRRFADIDLHLIREMIEDWIIRIKKLSDLIHV